jgi:hypothetical protein
MNHTDETKIQVQGQWYNIRLMWNVACFLVFIEYCTEVGAGMVISIGLTHREPMISGLKEIWNVLT